MTTVNIPEKFFQIVNKINEKNPYYLLLITIGGLCIVFYLFPIQFQGAALQALTPKVRDLGQDLENTRNNIQRIAQYQKELTQLKTKLDYINKKIKPKEELPALLEMISLIASKNNVKIEQVMPQTTAQKAVLDNSDGKYFAVPIVIEARSGYHDFGRFLNQLEQEGVFTDLSDFTFASEAMDANRHLIKMTMKTILLDKKDSKDAKKN